MEGLIKGLIDVAVGGADQDGERERDSQSFEERSRSTWAEVVSGDHDDDDDENGRGSDRNRNQYQRNEGRHGRNEWDSSISQPMMTPQQVMNQGHGEYNENRQDDYRKGHWNQKEQEDSNDGWETVGKSPSRHQKVPIDHWHDYKRPPGEQTYSNEIQNSANLEPTDEELSVLAKACNKLWELDLNRLIPGKDYEIDVGEGKKVYEKGDVADRCLLSWVNEDIFRKPTYSRFCSLLDNYNPHEGHKEVVTSEEKQEQIAFIEELSRTAPIKYLYKYLSSKGFLSGSYQDFKEMMINLWFGLYNRGGAYGSSSAFEHVFVGEIKQHGEQEVSGFHNWLQFYLEEAKGRLDYQGYILPQRHGQFPDSETQLLTIQFEWNGVLKSVSSTLIGVSPEFELALYTLCFFDGREENHVELGPYPVNIKCYKFGNKLGSAFPVADS